MAPLVALGIAVAVLSPPGNAARWQTERAQAIAALAHSDYAGAESHYEAALREAEVLQLREAGPHDLRLENSLTDLSAVMQARGKCADAEPLLLRALAIRIAEFGADSLEAAFASNNLGAIEQQLGRVDQARVLHARALEIARRRLAPNDPDLVPYLTHSGVLERSLGHDTVAEQLFNEALSLTTNGERRAKILLHMARAYASEGRYADADTAYQRALDSGPETVDRIAILSNRGDLFASRHMYRSAQPLLATAVQLCGDPGLAESVTCAVATNNLTSVEISIGLAPEAERNQQRALAILRRFAGNQNSSTATAVINLGAIYAKQHKYKKAESLYREAIEMDRGSPARLGSDLNRLAVLLFQEKRYLDAETTLRRAIETPTAQSDPYLNLAVVLQARHKREEAVPNYQLGIELLTKEGKRDTPQMAAVLENYSQLLREMEQWADAEKAATEAMGIRVKQALHTDTFR